MCEFSYTQIVSFLTWSRTVNGILRESILNYTYLSDPTITTELYIIKPVFGDHLLLACGIETGKAKEVAKFRRTHLKTS
jgi:hypothetical protein